MDTFTPIDDNKLSKKESTEAIASLMLLTEKYGIIKGIKCADGIKQWSHIKIDDAKSSTVSLKAILITSEIEAHYGRDVAKIHTIILSIYILIKRSHYYNERKTSGIIGEYIP